MGDYAFNPALGPNIEDRRGEDPGLAEAKDIMGDQESLQDHISKRILWNSAVKNAPKKTKDPIAKAAGYNDIDSPQLRKRIKVDDAENFRDSILENYEGVSKGGKAFMGGYAGGFGGFYKGK